MLDKIDVAKALTRWPYFIYQRVLLNGAKGYFFFPIDRGYFYWIRYLRAKWAEVDAAGVAFAPELYIEVVDNGSRISHQNNPVPLRLITSPASNGVQINGGGQMTATGARNAKLLNEIRPHQDNITLLISGQNAVPFPVFVDVLIVGYMLPDTSREEWTGSNDG